MGLCEKDVSYCLKLRKKSLEKNLTMRTQSSATENTYKTILEFIHILRCATSRMGPNDLYFMSLKFMGRLLSWNVDCTY